MTPGRAALVGLMDRYLGGLLDPFVSLLEVHKLMYLMQEAEENLDLRFQKAPLGPYAENLRHVLRAIEGHLISGYADGGDAPNKELELVPGAVEDARAFLKDHSETRARFDKVSELVDGFESPFGLELLTTVHWIASENASATEDKRSLLKHISGVSESRYSLSVRFASHSMSLESRAGLKRAIVRMMSSPRERLVRAGGRCA